MDTRIIFAHYLGRIDRHDLNEDGPKIVVSKVVLVLVVEIQ